MPHYFTQNEANELLAALIPHVERMMASWRRILDLEREAGAVLEQNAHSDVGGGALTQLAAEMLRAQEAIAAIGMHGVEIKDPGIGLLDFPALRDSEVVYLCWRYGEPRVAFWHPIETGFAGRQPLDD